MLKIPKNSKAFALAGFFLVWLMVAAVPHAGYAYEFYYPTTVGPASGEVCAIDSSVEDNQAEFGLTKRIIICVKETVIAVVYENFVPFVDYLADTIGILMTLAVIIWGIQMTSGKATAPVKDAMILGMKMGAVLLFCTSYNGSYFGDNLFDPGGEKGGLFGMLLDAMEGILSMVVTTVGISSAFNCDVLSIDPVLAVWDAVDCALDSLVGGIFSPFTLSEGLIGFLIAAFFSSAAGFFIAIMGVVLIIMLLLSIARAVYIFITGYLAFALMVLISPLFIPLILFTSTKAYFEKWLKLTMGFMLQPIFVIAYLIMLLTAFDTIVYTGNRSLYRAIAGDIIDDSSEFGFTSIGEWVNDNYGYVQASAGDMGVKTRYTATGAACVEDKNNPDCQPEADQLTKMETAPFGAIGKEIEGTATAGKNSVYKALGTFKVDVPIRTIDWNAMAINSRYDADAFFNAAFAYDEYRYDPQGDPLNYITDVFMPYITNILISCFMALVTGYIFMTMLKFLPFIGSGISGETLSMPTFGVGKFALPGQSSMKGLQNRVTDNFFKRK